MLPYDMSRLGDPARAARDLLGAILLRTMPDGTRLSGRIVETEAYHESDPASHTYRGPTARNKAMFGPAGRAYIYRSYGIHWCMNITCGTTGEGAGVLIRALEPLEGVHVMEVLRGRKGRELTSGPGRLSEALAIDGSLYGHHLAEPPLQLLQGETVPDGMVRQTTRIGLTKGADALLRFLVVDSVFVSGKRS